MVQENGQNQRVLPDTVVPVGMFDDTEIQRPVIIYTTFLFDGVLDVSQLRHSLQKLLEQDGWNKVGARLRRNETSACLEHHIPSQFHAERPAFRFWHVKHDMTMRDHPLASKIPVPSTMPVAMVDPEQFQPFCIDPNAPTKIEHYLQCDEPQLGLIITSFQDSTIVSISWTHLLFDAMGLGELLHAWSLMLQNRPDEIRKPFGTQHDALAGLGRKPAQPYRLEGSRLSWIGAFIFHVRTLFEMTWYKQQSRMIYVPGQFIKQLREDATKGLDHASQDGDNRFLSDGDIICAWWAKMNAAHLSNSNRLVHLANPISWRSSLAKDLLPSNRPYISNAVGFFSVLIPARDILTKPIWYLAQRIRQSITESRQREQVEAYAAMLRNSRGMSLPLFGDPTMHMSICSNWSKANLFSLDFSSALIRQGNRVSSVEQGRPSCVQNCFRGVHLTNFMIVVGKDSLGGYWLTAIAKAKYWTGIQQAIAQSEHPRR